MFSEHFVKGELIVEMRENTEARVFVGMFPELRIEYIVDLYEKAKSDLGGGPINLSNKTIFHIRLADDADENVFAAIDILSKHSGVVYAVPNGGSFYVNDFVAVLMNYGDFEPGVVLVVVEPSMYADEFIESFPDIPIEDAIDIKLSVGLTGPQDSATFHVVLESKTKQSVYEAIEKFVEHPDVKHAMPNHLGIDFWD